MRKIIILFFIFFAGKGFSQNELVIKSKISSDAIELRWAVSDVKWCKQAIKNGFILQRSETGTAKIDFEVKIVAREKSDSLWHGYFKLFPEAGMIYSFIYPDKSRTKTEEENMFGLVLLSCDLNTDLASISGLYFKDSLFDVNKKYTYKLSIPETHFSKSITVNPKELSVFPVISEWEIKNTNRENVISWNFMKYISFYSGYILERSEDSLNFIPLMNRPFIPMASQYEEEKEITFFNDTGLIENKWYWYRISGKDHFGGFGPYSKYIKVKSIASFEGEFIVDTLFETDPGKIQLKWKNTHQNDIHRISKTEVYRSDKIDGKYSLLPVSGQMNQELQFHLTERVNYIKIVFYNHHLKTETWPELYLMTDKIPPAIPDSLHGMIDKNGMVHLTWSKNHERDFKGFRVYRSNALHEEFTEVSENFISANQFTDSVRLESLTEEIYYCVNAVDVNYNNSQKSVPLKLMKPDMIAPAITPILKMEAKIEGNSIQWAKSFSNDVVRIELLRSKDGLNYSSVFSGDSTVTSFLDSTLENGNGYFYKTVTMDDAGLTSESEALYLKNDVFKIIVNESAKVWVDRKEKFIRLSWQPLNEDVYSYTVYKAKKGENLRSYKSLKANQTEITDKELYIGNEYVYSVKAMLKSGREVMVVKEKRVEY